MFDSLTEKANKCLEKLSMIVKNEIEKIDDTTKEQSSKFEEELKKYANSRMIFNTKLLISWTTWP